jgi:pyrroloquinoline quinone biosynthesis protein B
MIVRVLGSAAGGGVPQWNCACANCGAARAGTQPRRSSSGFAVSGDGARWWLVNVSPDIAQQVEAYPPLQPRAGRGTPIVGMLLTDANVDLGGFAVLRQDGDHAFAVFSSATVRAIATEQPAFATFAHPPHAWRALGPNEEIDLDERLRVRVVPVDGLTPGYAGRQPLPDAVVAYVVTDRESDASVLFAPVFADVGPDLLAAARDADAAFFDGSFWSDDELSSAGVPKAARSLGHAPVGGPDGSMVRLATLERGPRYFFAHLNNTNPLLDPSSAEAHAIAHAGFAVAYDGLEFPESDRDDLLLRRPGRTARIRGVAAP